MSWCFYLQLNLTVTIVKTVKLLKQTTTMKIVTTLANWKFHKTLCTTYVFIKQSFSSQMILFYYLYEWLAYRTRFFDILLLDLTCRNLFPADGRSWRRYLHFGSLYTVHIDFKTVGRVFSFICQWIFDRMATLI